MMVLVGCFEGSTIFNEKVFTPSEAEARCSANKTRIRLLLFLSCGNDLSIICASIGHTMSCYGKRRVLVVLGWSLLCLFE